MYWGKGREDFENVKGEREQRYTVDIINLNNSICKNRVFLVDEQFSVSSTRRLLRVCEYIKGMSWNNEKFGGRYLNSNITDISIEIAIMWYR